MAVSDALGERQGGAQDMIDKLLRERQQMLVLFCQVAGLEPYTKEQSTLDALQEFCEVLVDYAAFCHFEIYEGIIKGGEAHPELLRVAEQVSPRIAEASEFAVAFSDRYDAEDHQLKLDNLAHDLSMLGEELAIRIEMEDQIIAVLMQG